MLDRRLQSARGNDILPKLAEPSGKPAEFKSWLLKDPALESVVEEFAETCQNLNEDIIMYLA